MPGVVCKDHKILAPDLVRLRDQETLPPHGPNFPSEVLTPDTQPSARLLALAHQLHVKKEYRWLPRKFRMSVSRSEEMNLHRASKVPRLENIQLHQLLIDEVPSLEISNQNLGLNAVSRILISTIMHGPW